MFFLEEKLTFYNQNTDDGDEEEELNDPDKELEDNDELGIEKEELTEDEEMGEDETF